MAGPPDALVLLQTALDKFLPPEHTTGRYSDAEIGEISQLLKSHGREGWASHPRLCIVLCKSGGLVGMKHMDALIGKGYGDKWFPYREQEIPSILDPGVAARFIRDQGVVLTKELTVANGGHWNLDDGELESIFDVGKRLGGGGSGEVMEVKRRTDGKLYALKRTYRQRAFEMGTKYFIREIQSLAGTVHHHIVEYVGSFATPIHVGTIMSPVAECNLETFLTSAQQQSDKRTWLWTYFGCLAHALRYLHYTRRVRHKDIKAANIVIKERRPLLTDFGLSYDWSATKGLMTTTVTEKYRTAKYCAPEVTKRGGVTSKSDIFSLGCVFLEIMTVLRGEWLETMNTFFRENGEKELSFSGNRDAVSLWIHRLRSNERPQCEDKPLTWVEQMLDKDPERRPNARKLVELIWSPGNDSDQSDYSFQFHGICCTKSEMDGVPIFSLHHAVTDLDEEHLTELLETGTDPNLKNTDGLTVLHQSAQNGQMSLADLLLKRGHNIHINEKDNDGKTALHWAAEKGNAEVATLLMENGATIDITESQFGYTPLHSAAYFGHENVVRRLLEKNPDLTVETRAGYTAEGLAELWKREALVQLLKTAARVGEEKKITNTATIDVAKVPMKKGDRGRKAAQLGPEAKNGRGVVQGRQKKMIRPATELKAQGQKGKEVSASKPHWRP